MISQLFYGDSISPGSQPALIFPLLVGQIELATDLLSTIASFIITGATEGPLTAAAATDEEFGTPNGPTDSFDALTAITLASGHGIIGFQNLHPLTGQVANITATVSQDGANFVAATGTLSEIGATGYYKYVPNPTETNNPPLQNSSNTGTVFFRFKPTNPRAATQTNTWIYESLVWFRLRPLGFSQVALAPGQASNINTTLNQPGGPIDEIKKYIQSAIRDLLGNQMTNKPTFRRDG